MIGEECRLYVDQKIKKLKKHSRVENERIFDCIRKLEGSFIQNIQALEKTVVYRFQDYENRLEILEKKLEATPTQNNPRPPLKRYYDREEDLPKVVTIKGLPPTPHTLFPVTIETKKQRGKDSDCVEYNYQPVHMQDMKAIKEAISMYGVQSSYVKQFLNSWSTQNRIIPQDWMQLTSAVLNDSQQLQWRNWFREEARALESRHQNGDVNISRDQILGEGRFADVAVQTSYDELTLMVCRTAALNAWEKILDPGQKIESYTQVKQNPREPYTDFLQRLTQAVHRTVSDPGVRKQLILSLAFDNADKAYKQMLMPLKIRGAPIEDWIQYAINAESLHSNEENWVGQAVTNVRMRNQGVICFKCGKPGHIKRNCTHGSYKSISNQRPDWNRRSLPSGLCRRCGKGRHWTNECRSLRDKEGNILPSGNMTRGFPREAPKKQDTKTKKIQSYPVTMEEQLPQDE